MYETLFVNNAQVWLKCSTLLTHANIYSYKQNTFYQTTFQSACS